METRRKKKSSRYNEMKLPSQNSYIQLSAPSALAALLNVNGRDQVLRLRRTDGPFARWIRDQVLVGTFVRLRHIGLQSEYQGWLTPALALRNHVVVNVG